MTENSMHRPFPVREICSPFVRHRGCKASTLAALAMLALLVVLSLFTSVKAIPAFARKYQVACTNCHIAIPQRNAFGEAFRRNGYIMPKQDRNQIKQRPVELGAEGWKEVFPNTIWPGLLPAEFPLAAYLHQRITADLSQSAEKKSIQFDMPHELELILGGTIDKTFSFFGEYVLFDDGKSETELERLFIQVNDMVGPENVLNLRFGLLEPGITDGMTGNNGFTLEKPSVLTYRATGTWRMKDSQSGMEINGIVRHRFRYAAGMVNGEGKTVEDSSSNMDFYGRVAYKLGGLAFDGLAGGDTSISRPSNYWVDNSLATGIFVYRGYESRHYTKWEFTSPVDSILVPASKENDFTRIGCDVQFNHRRLDFLSGIIFGTDKIPESTTGAVRKVTSRAWFGESRYLFYPWCIGLLRLSGTKSHYDEENSESSTSILTNLTMLARQNVRISFEGLVEVDGKKGFLSRWIKSNFLIAF